MSIGSRTILVVAAFGCIVLLGLEDVAEWMIDSGYSPLDLQMAIVMVISILVIAPYLGQLLPFLYWLPGPRRRQQEPQPVYFEDDHGGAPYQPQGGRYDGHP